MNTQKFTVGVITLVVAVILVTGVLIPVISDSISDDGYQNDIRDSVNMTYNTQNDDFSMTITINENWEGEITVNTNGDTQTISFDGDWYHTFFACENVIVTNSYILYTENELNKCSSSEYYTTYGNYVIEKTGDTVTVTYPGWDEETTHTITVPCGDWYFIPDNDGKYLSGFISGDGDVIYTDDKTILIGLNGDVFGKVVVNGKYYNENGSTITDVELDTTETNGGISDCSYSVDDVTLPVTVVIVPAEITVSTSMSPTLSSMLSIIPLIVTVGLILGAVTMFIRKS